MDGKLLMQDGDGVSPVIGAILMVAITVMLAAVIGSLVLSLDVQQQSTPVVTFTYTVDDNGDGFGDTDDVVTLTHDGGESLRLSALTITVGDDTAVLNGTTWASTVSVGDTVEVTDGSAGMMSGRAALTGGDGNIRRGDVVRVIWNPDNTDRATVIFRFRVD